MTGAVRSAAFDAVLPAFDGAINNRGRLAVIEFEREALRHRDLLPIETVRHEDHVPIVEIRQLGRRPLHVIARRFPIAADPVRVDRGLIPIDVQDDVAQRSGSGRGQRFPYPARGHSAFALYYMYAGRVIAVKVGRGPSQAERRGNADARRAGAQPHERCGRGRMSVECFGAELFDERRACRRIAAEAQQIFEAQLRFFLGRQQLRRGDARHFIAQRPHRIKPERLVPGRVGNDVRVLPARVREIVIHCLEKQSLHETSAGNRTAGMTGERRVVEHRGAQRPVEKIQRFAMIERGRIKRLALFGHAIGCIDVDAAPRPERHDGGLGLRSSRPCFTGDEIR